MGNMVTFSVRHDLMSLISCSEFSPVRALMNQSDNQIKIHQQSEQWAHGFVHLNSLPGIISSKYHHASDDCDLLVSNQWLTAMPARLHIRKHQDTFPWSMIYPPELDLNPPELALKAVRGFVAQTEGKALHQHKAVPVPNPERSTYTVFGYKTDYCSEFEANPELMANILAHCRTGLWNDDINPDVHQIQSLGTYDADTSVLITMSKGSFSVIPVPFAPIEVVQDVQIAHAQAIQAYRPSDVDSIVEESKIRALAKGLGFDLVAKKPKLEQEASWAPK